MGGENQPPVKVDGGSAGDGVHTGYRVDHDRADWIAELVAAEIPAISDAGTAITDAITAAETALPNTFTTAIARLKELREDHVADVTTVHTFAEGALASLRACLDIYENTSADQVAATVRYEGQLVFDHGSAFGQTQAWLNRELDSASMPSQDAAYLRERSYAHVGTTTDTGESSTTTHTRTLSDMGTTTTSTDTYAYSRDGDVTTSEQTYTASRASNGVTDTTTYYNGTSFRGMGHDESTVSGRSYTVSGDGHSTTTTDGSMQVPR